MPIIEGYTNRFASAIGEEMQSLSSSPFHNERCPIRFKCQHITVVALFTAAAHAHATGYLILNSPDNNPRVDIQVKGILKSPVMECVRLFHEVLIRISMAGEFLMGGSEDFCLGDIRAVIRTLPVQILTSTGWKTAEKIETSLGPNGMLHAFVHFANGSESRHLFLPQANGDGLVEVTHMTSTGQASACLAQRQKSCLLMAKLFCRRLCRFQLSLDAYTIDRTNRVLVVTRQQTSKRTSLLEAVRNGFSLYLNNTIVDGCDRVSTP